jgi:hypothetical protein
MSFTISSYDENQVNVGLSYTSKEALYCLIYIKLKENIYNKMEFLDSVAKSQKMMGVFKDAMFISHPSSYNIIQMFIEDKDFNVIINRQLVDFMIIFLDNYSYQILKPTINFIIDNYFLKSQYLEASTTSDIMYQRKEKYLLNLTYFLIELFNKKFKNSVDSTFKTYIVDKIVHLLDIGVINYYEELNLRRADLIILRSELEQVRTNEELTILTEEKNDIIKRRLYLNKILGEMYYSVGDFIDYLMEDFYKIRNRDVYNIIYVYKKNNPFFYKNIFHFITFSKLIMQSISIHSKEFIIEYSNFYFDLTLKSINNEFLKHISSTVFLREIFNTAYNISKTDIDIDLYLLNIASIVDKMENKGSIIRIVNTNFQKKIAYTFLSQIKQVASYKNEVVIAYLTFIGKINKDILLSYEIRNIYIETIFTLFNSIFKNKVILGSNKPLADLLNEIIYSFISKSYNSVLDYFSSDINPLCTSSWDNYNEIYNNKNYLFTNFAETIKLQIDYKTSQNLSRDPICSSIIECPVKIPDTNIYMDRYIISRCLMEKEENPFNRTKLTLNDIKIKF